VRIGGIAGGALLLGWWALAACSSGCERTTGGQSPAESADAAPGRGADPDAEADAQAQKGAERGARFVGLLAAGEFSQAASHFDGPMRAAMDAAGLEAAWKGLGARLGAFRGVEGVDTERRGELVAALVRCRFASGLVLARVVLDPGGQVTGLWFKPAAPAWEPPAYADRQRFEEREVVVGQGAWATPGVLSLPRGPGPFPAVVLVHGSGPSDRDETVGQQRPFKDLAFGLASRGIVVLRYDKRTLSHAAVLKAKLEEFTPQQEYVDDALAAVALLKGEARVDPQRIFVLGHSAGGRYAPRIAQASADVAGAVLLAGGARPFARVILEQYEYLASLDGVVAPEEKDAIADMRRRVAPLADPERLARTPAAELPFGVPAAYWQAELAHDQVAVARSLGKPLLVLQGERDYQVTMEDFDGWRKGLAGVARVTFKSYPRLNHLFSEGEGKGTPDEYNQPGHVAAVVIEDLATWLAGPPP